MIGKINEEWPLKATTERSDIYQKDKKINLEDWPQKAQKTQERFLQGGREDWTVDNAN